MTAPPLRCILQRKQQHITCGDYIDFRVDRQNQARIVRMHPRKNLLSRQGFRQQSKHLASNIDVLVIVIAWLPKPSWSMLDRYLIVAKHLPCETIIIANKSDLKHKYSSDEDHQCLKEYQDIGYPLLELEANNINSYQFNKLTSRLENKTGILVGQSGVGKSSIVKALTQKDNISTNAISTTGSGKHTTTATELHTLRHQNTNNAYIIDSPGVRDFLPEDINKNMLKEGFEEFTPYRDLCKFNNCDHHKEPKCAIREAFENHEIPPLRYQRYLGMLKQMD